MAKSTGKKVNDSGDSPAEPRKKTGPGAGRTFTRTDYGISAEQFVTAWEQSETADDVYARLKAISEGQGRPVMPKPILLARAAEYRAAKIPLKKLKRVTSRDLDVPGLTDLVERLRAGKESNPPATPAPTPPPPGFTNEQFEAVVEEVLRRLRARG